VRVVHPLQFAVSWGADGPAGLLQLADGLLPAGAQQRPERSLVRGQHFLRIERLLLRLWTRPREPVALTTSGNEYSQPLNSSEHASQRTQSKSAW